EVTSNLAASVSTQSSGANPSPSSVIMADQWKVIGIAYLTGKDTDPEEPIVSANLNGKDVKILLDSGGKVTLIKRVHVPAETIRNGAPMYLDGLGGLKYSNEIATFQILCDKSE